MAEKTPIIYYILAGGGWVVLQCLRVRCVACFEDCDFVDLGEDKPDDKRYECSRCGNMM